jgi:hypothetical protein
MAVLGSSDRIGIGAALQSDASQAREAFGAVVKADIQAAVAAADDWAVANAASFNSALPLAARNGLTAAQKARLLMYVIRRRYETGA